MALGPNEVCVILLGPSCGNPYNPWNQTWTVKLPPPQGHQWCQSHLQRYIRTYIHLTTCVGIGCTIIEGGSYAARADSCAAHSLQPGSSVSKVLYLSDIHFDKNYTAGLNAECGEPLCCRPPNGPPRESLCLYTCSNSCTSYVQTPSLYPRSPWCFCSSWQACSRPLGRLQLRLSPADLGDPAAACRQHEQQGVPGTAQCVCTQCHFCLSCIL